MRRALTVPAAGETKNFGMTGITAVIENCLLYETPEDVPLLGFDSGNQQYPIYPPETQYENEQGKFNSLSITGTAASAGDTVNILTVDDCLGTVINPTLRNQFEAAAGTTDLKAASDAVQTFSEVELVNAAGQLPSKLYIYVLGGATRGINFAFNADPSQGYPPTDSYYWDNEQAHGGASQPSPIDPLEIVGIDWILNFRFIASVATETPDLIWTPEY